MNTKKIIPRFISKSVTTAYLSLCLVLALVPSHSAFAEANQLFVSPGSSQMTKGTTFCIDVKSYAADSADVGTAVGAITYPASKLQVVSGSIKTSGSTCSGTTSTHYGAHSVTKSSGKLSFNASRENTSGGIAQIFTVKFKALAGGTAQVKFTTGSKVNGLETTYSHGSFSITDPSPPKSSPSTNSPKPSASPTPTPTNSNQNEDDTDSVPDPSGVVTSVTIDSDYETATLTWAITGKKTKSTLKYGLDATNPESTAKVTKKSDGTYTATINDLTPGGQYFFVISGTGSGVKGEYSSAIYARGYPVVMNITENDIAAANAIVRIGNINNTADANGKLALGLAAGDYSGTITTNTATLNINFSVETKDIPSDGDSPELQNFAFNLSSSILDQGPGTGFSILAFIGILAVGTVILGVGFVIFVTYRRKRFDVDDSAKTMRQSVVVDDGFDWEEYQAGQSQKTPPQQTSPNDSNLLPPPPPSSQHRNSVYLNEEEPEDMFDFDKKSQADEPPKGKGEENEGSGINISR